MFRHIYLRIINTLYFTRDIFLVPAMRKQWPLQSNDAVSIFQSWQGGGGRALESLLWDPQDVLRKKSVQSCTLAFWAREVHGRAALTVCIRCPKESPWNMGFLNQNTECPLSVLLRKMGSYSCPAVANVDWIFLCGENEGRLETGTIGSFFQ